MELRGSSRRASSDTVVSRSKEDTNSTKNENSTSELKNETSPDKKSKKAAAAIKSHDSEIEISRLKNQLSDVSKKLEEADLELKEKDNEISKLKEELSAEKLSSKKLSDDLAAISKSNEDLEEKNSSTESSLDPVRNAEHEQLTAMKDESMNENIDLQFLNLEMIKSKETIAYLKLQLEKYAELETNQMLPAKEDKKDSNDYDMLLSQCEDLKQHLRSFVSWETNGFMCEECFKTLQDYKRKDPANWNFAVLSNGSSICTKEEFDEIKTKFVEVINMLCHVNEPSEEITKMERTKNLSSFKDIVPLLQCLFDVLVKPDETPTKGKKKATVTFAEKDIDKNINIWKNTIKNLERERLSMLQNDAKVTKNLQIETAAKEVLEKKIEVIQKEHAATCSNLRRLIQVEKDRHTNQDKYLRTLQRDKIDLLKQMEDLLADFDDMKAVAQSPCIACKEYKKEIDDVRKQNNIFERTKKEEELRVVEIRRINDSLQRQLEIASKQKRELELKYKTKLAFSFGGVADKNKVIDLLMDRSIGSMKRKLSITDSELSDDNQPEAIEVLDSEDEEVDESEHDQGVASTVTDTSSEEEEEDEINGRASDEISTDENHEINRHSSKRIRVNYEDEEYLSSDDPS